VLQDYPENQFGNEFTLREREFFLESAMYYKVESRMLLFALNASNQRRSVRQTTTTRHKEYYS